jgi:hypothetical protein
MSKISRNSTNAGFMKDPAYSFYFHDILNEFENEFAAVDNVDVEIRELMPYEMADRANNPKPNRGFKLDIDSSTLFIGFDQGRYYNSKGKANGAPDPGTVISSLRSTMKSAAKWLIDQQNSNNEDNLG